MAGSVAPRPAQWAAMARKSIPESNTQFSLQAERAAR
jgi:hypothetical protein